MACIARLESRYMHEPEPDGIDADRFRHFIHHDFPGPFCFLLVITPRWSGPVRIRSICAPQRPPVRNRGRIQIHLVRRASRIRSVSADFGITTAHVDFVCDGCDSAVFPGSDLEFGDRLGFDQKLRELLVFGQHDFYGPAGHLCQVCDQRVKPFGRQPCRSEC